MALGIGKTLTSTVPTVHNDFHNPNGIFPLFDGLELKDASARFSGAVNGHVNGNNHVNGDHSSAVAQDLKNDHDLTSGHSAH